MEYTIISIQDTKDKLIKLDQSVTGNGLTTFDYGAIVPEPEWLKFVPEEPVSLYNGDIPDEDVILDNVTLDVRQTSTLRAWFLESISTLNQVNLIPRNSYAGNIDLTHTIMDRRLSDVTEELIFQTNMRPDKTIRDLYGYTLGRVIECWLCHKLSISSGVNCRSKWKELYIGTKIEGVVIERETNLVDENPHIAYTVQTVGGTPWTFFRALSTAYPNARITVSDIDLSRSIIQIKLYRKGKIVTTMTTEDTTIFRQLELHVRDVFNGVYFYIPTQRAY